MAIPSAAAKDGSSDDGEIKSVVRSIHDLSRFGIDVETEPSYPNVDLQTMCLFSGRLAITLVTGVVKIFDYMP
jgi:hypothetical protein